MDTPRLALQVYHHQPHEGVQRQVLKIAEGARRIVEIGPGQSPFPLAQEFVDWIEYPSLSGKKVHRVDLNQEPLPFEDKSIDFLYCRHVVEDMYNPFLLCREMSRVAKAGYIETPSPFAEYCRGMNGMLIPEGSFWRGYIHHRYIVWDEGGTLCFLAKYPLAEYIDLDCDEEVAHLLETEPLHWNTYFLWEGSIPIRHLQHDIDFRLQENYAEMIRRGLDSSLEANVALRERYQL
jgi:hypothetical protein